MMSSVQVQQLVVFSKLKKCRISVQPETLNHILNNQDIKFTNINFYKTEFYQIGMLAKSLPSIWGQILHMCACKYTGMHAWV